MYMDYLFYLKSLSQEERIEQILLISAILGGLFIIAIAIEIFKKKYNKKYEKVKNLLNKLNVFNYEKRKTDV